MIPCLSFVNRPGVSVTVKYLHNRNGRKSPIFARSNFNILPIEEKKALEKIFLYFTEVLNQIRKEKHFV
jgi:hypothetical protein